MMVRKNALQCESDTAFLGEFVDVFAALGTKSCPVARPKIFTFRFVFGCNVSVVADRREPR